MSLPSISGPSPQSLIVPAEVGEKPEAQPDNEAAESVKSPLKDYQGTRIDTLA